MLTYSFVDIGSDSLYGHLYKCIKNDILRGALTAGEKLPSKRSFAKNLGISTITVENAYAQLMDEGYLYSIPKKGYFVTALEALPKPMGVTTKPKDVDVDTTSQSMAVPLADFISNQTDADQFPFSIWARIMREVLADDQAALMRNAPSGGVGALRLAIAGYLKDFRGMAVDPNQIIVGAGTEYLYGLLIQLLGREACYAVEDPGYDKIAKIYDRHGVNCQPVAMDGNGVTLSALEASGATVAHLTPAHHFPTGITMPISRRYELLGWASRSPKRYLIEDDYDSEFRLTGLPIPTLQSIDVMGKVIYMNTFSKTLASTVRISYMVLPPDLAAEYYDRLGFYSCTVSNFEQYVLARFISEGFFEKHINRMRNYYHTKRDTLLRMIGESPLAARVEIREEDAGLHFLLTIDTTMSDDELTARAEAEGIRVAALSRFYAEPRAAAAHTFIINYSHIAEERMAEAVEGLYRAVVTPLEN